MLFDWKLWPLYKHKRLVAQFLMAAIFVGFAFRLVFFRSPAFNPDLETSFIDRTIVSTELPKARDRVALPPLSAPGDRIQRRIAPPGNEDQAAKPPLSFPGDRIQRRLAPPARPRNEGQEAEPPVAGEFPEDIIPGKCDLSAGDWIPDQTGPFYTNETCHLIEGHQNCMRNGRPDTGYLYWRWNPRNCELPRFDPQRFLDLMRNKAWALVGDSISRNHVQSLLCTLSTVEQAIQVYHDEGYKSKRWVFPSYNFTMSVIWSPFLVEAATFEDNNGVSTAEVELQLDRLDTSWTDQYQNLDYMIISTGEWFLKNAIYHENNTVLGCHGCDPKRNLTELGFNFAYRKSLRTVLTFLATTKHNGMVFFRTSAPDHFDGGEWHNGGKCPLTAPFKDGEIELKDLHHYLRDPELEEFKKASPKAAENGVDLRLLDLMKLSLLRPDGHPGPYRQFQPFARDKNATVQNDCLHWCLPGPIDSWNDVIMEMMLSG